MSSVDQPPVPPLRRTRVWMWLAMLAVAVTTALAVVSGARSATFFLAAAMFVFAVVRGVSPAPGPYGLSTRSRTFDVTLFVIGGFVIAGLTLSLAPGTLD